MQGGGKGEEFAFVEVGVKEWLTLGKARLLADFLTEVAYSKQ